MSTNNQSNKPNNNGKKQPIDEKNIESQPSEPLITRSAKEFLTDANRSNKFIQAADFTVSRVMAAIEAKIDLNVKASAEKRTEIEKGHSRQVKK